MTTYAGWTTGMISNYLEDRLVNFTLRGTYYPSGSSVWLALFTTSPWESGSGIEVSQRATGNYSRKAVINGFTVTNGEAYNKANIAFPTTSASWGTITHIGIMSASQASASTCLLFYGEMAEPQTVSTANMEVLVPTGELRVALGEGGTSIPRTTIPNSQWAYPFCNTLLDNLLNGAPYSGTLSSVYIGLYITMPDKFDLGGIEVSALNYTRKRVSAGTGNGWATTTNGSTCNINLVPFITKSAYHWGTVEGLCIRSALTGGMLLYRGYLNHPITITYGDTFSISASAIQVYIDTPGILYDNNVDPPFSPTS